MSTTDDPPSKPNRIAFSTRDLPAHLDDRARRNAWLEHMESMVMSFDIVRADERPFGARYDVASFGDLMIVEGRGTATHMNRTKRHLASDTTDCFFLNLNAESDPIVASSHGREMKLTTGTMGLTSSSVPGSYQIAAGRRLRNAVVSRETLSGIVRNPDDLTYRALNPDLPATRLLKQYFQLLLDSRGLEDDLSVGTYVNRTFTDLLALALGADRETAELATGRGARAAKRQLILKGIQSGFDDPTFSEHVLGANLRIAPRTIRDLLFETGMTFSERVLELRLQKARAMLSDARHDRMKVSDIAYACGFNEVSYFNRRFRRRFGASPTELRM